MKQLVVLSGKGGTGKTSVTAALASLWQKKVVCVDADVDAANLHLLLHPENHRREAFVGGKLAVCDPNLCNECGHCDDLCRFHAIHRGRVAAIACEGCGLCALACSQQAMALADRVSGTWFEGTTEVGAMFYARLGVGEGNSGKLVGKLHERARQFALQHGLDWVLTDGPPGTGCPTMAALTGNDAVLAVTEPSAAGLHDLDRLLDLAENFGVKPFVCINKIDLHLDLGAKIRQFCSDRRVPIVGSIPFDPSVIEGARRGLPVMHWSESSAAQALRRMHRNLVWLLKREQAELPETKTVLAVKRTHGTQPQV